MDWKGIFKYIFLLYGIFLGFGLIVYLFFTFSENINLYFIAPSSQISIFFWSLALISCIIIPIIYAFFNKRKTIKELLIISILFIILSGIISSFAIDITPKLAREAEGGISGHIADTQYIFASTPVSSLARTVCYSITDPGDLFAVCITNNTILFMMIFFLLAFIIFFTSLYLGQFFAKFRKYTANENSSYK